MRLFRFPIMLLLVFSPILVTFSCGSSGDYSSGGQPGNVTTTVSGRVVDQYGAGIEGVTVEAWSGTSYPGCQEQLPSGTQPQTIETLTDAAGFYEFSEESSTGISGSAQIRPLGIWNGTRHTGYSFEPAAYYISLSAGNTVALDDFVGTPAYWVTGYITNSSGGVSGVTVQLSDGVSTWSKTTLSNGYYSFLALEGDYTITPIAAVDPSSRNVAVYGDDVTGQDFEFFFY